MLQAIMIAGPNDRLAIVFFGKYFFGKGKSPIDMERSQGVKKLQRSSTRVHIIRMHEHERLRNPFHNPIIRSHRKTSFALSVFLLLILLWRSIPSSSESTHWAPSSDRVATARTKSVNENKRRATYLERWCLLRRSGWIEVAYSWWRWAQNNVPSDSIRFQSFVLAE